MATLKCATSLWSADLADLVAEMRRVADYSDRFHLDVSDGHYQPVLLFFPDLVRAIRRHTSLPLEVHLMTNDPTRWVEDFVTAGADTVIFQLDTLDDPKAAIANVHNHGAGCGIALSLDDPVDALDHHLDALELVTVIGTALGVKGAELDPRVPAKIQQARQAIDQRSLTTELQVDGGIRRHTVPDLAAAGADSIVPGSLMFSGDPAELRQWITTL